MFSVVSLIHFKSAKIVVYFYIKDT